jgi:DNA polymerase-3 subunit epsilon
MAKNSFFHTVKRNNQIVLNEMSSETILATLGQLQSQKGLNKGVFLDVETTGLDHQNSTIIEIALREFFFDNNCNFIGLGQNYNSLSDPGFPIPPEITKITGLSDSDVKGHKFNWGIINQICETSAIIVAHNAHFDRNFMIAQKEFSALPLLWGCSKSQIPWKDFGFKWRDLEALAVFHGFYYSSHRALMDVDALGYLLTRGSYFSLLLQEAIRPVVRVKALHSPFEVKDVLKAKGYTWDANLKYWWKDEPKDQMEQVWNWLQSEIYKNGGIQNCKFEEIENHRKFDY